VVKLHSIKFYENPLISYVWGNRHGEVCRHIYLLCVGKQTWWSVKAHLFSLTKLHGFNTFVCYVWGNRHGEVWRHICLLCVGKQTWWSV